MAATMSAATGGIRRWPGLSGRDISGRRSRVQAGSGDVAAAALVAAMADPGRAFDAIVVGERKLKAQSRPASTILLARPSGLVKMTSWLPGIWTRR